MALAQGTFRNLNFEQALVPVVPPDQSGGLVATADAIPGWIAWAGTNQLSQVYLNPVALGTATPAILGPFRSPSQTQVIEGNYSVQLFSGAGILFEPASAAVSQLGIIPIGARSLLVRIAGYDPAIHSVSFNGDVLSLVPVLTGQTDIQYGADISSLAGVSGDLRFTTFPAPGRPFTSLLFDAISFSDQAVPEPSVLGLLAVAVSLLGWRFANSKT